MPSPNVESISYLSPKEIEAYLKKILDEKNLYSEILENLDCGVGAVGKDAGLVSCNRKFVMLLNRQVDKANMPFYSTVQNDELRCFFAKSLSERIACEGEFCIGAPQMRFFISVMGFALSDEGFAFVVRDISKSKKQLQELKRLEGLAAVSSISSILAHDINNPLSAISVQADLIRRKAERSGDSFAVEHIGIIKSEIDRIKGIVQGFLFSSRPLQVVPLLQDPETLIAELARFVKPDLEQRGISLTCDILRPLPYVEFDFDQMYSCLLNLVKNSIEAIADKKGRREISILAARQYNSLAISVEDTGCGIRPEDADKIFKPYFTTKDKGTGLGLSNVYKIVRMHGGEIEASNRHDGDGVRFTIFLPLRKEDMLALGSEAPSSRAKGD